MVPPEVPMDALTPELKGVAETLLIPLTARVLESRRIDSAFTDPQAEDFLTMLDTDPEHWAAEWTNVEAVVGRTAILDRAAAAWVAEHPSGTIVNLGAGLCTRFFRVDTGNLRWVDVDLPEVIALKAALLQLPEATDRSRRR